MKTLYTWLIILPLLITITLIAINVIKNKNILKKSQLHYIHYDTKQRKVFHQGKPVLTLRKGSTNHKFIEYMFHNAEKTVTFNEVYKGAHIPKEKYLRKLLAGTKLPKTIRENAFKFEGSTITLTRKFLLDSEL